LLAMVVSEAMHELGIARSLVEVAVAAMTERCVTIPAKSLQVEVGRFTSVVPDSLRFYFEVLSRETLLEGAELAIETIPLRTRCQKCLVEAEPDIASLLCPSCDGLVEVVGGRELRLISIELSDEAA
jgi:hydrogenase nickel incorporation protein HypA/HybF